MKAKIFRVVAGLAGVYHVLLGGLGWLCPADTVVKVVDMAFGVALDAGPQTALVLKFTSVYMLAFGVMLLVLSSNPVKHRAVAIPALVLFGIRFINRVVLFSALTSAGMTVSRNVTGTALILFFFVALLLTLPKKQSGEQDHASTEDIAKQ